jgi:hypothetical protein
MIEFKNLEIDSNLQASLSKEPTSHGPETNTNKSASATIVFMARLRSGVKIGEIIAEIKKLGAKNHFSYLQKEPGGYVASKTNVDGFDAAEAASEAHKSRARINAGPYAAAMYATVDWTDRRGWKNARWVILGGMALLAACRAVDPEMTDATPTPLAASPTEVTINATPTTVLAPVATVPVYEPVHLITGLESQLSSAGISVMDTADVNGTGISGDCVIEYDVYNQLLSDGDALGILDSKVELARNALSVNPRNDFEVVMCLFDPTTSMSEVAFRNNEDKLFAANPDGTWREIQIVAHNEEGSTHWEDVSVDIMGRIDVLAQAEIDTFVSDHVELSRYVDHMVAFSVITPDGQSIPAIGFPEVVDSNGGLVNEEMLFIKVGHSFVSLSRFDEDGITAWQWNPSAGTEGTYETVFWYGFDENGNVKLYFAPPTGVTINGYTREDGGILLMTVPGPTFKDTVMGKVSDSTVEMEPASTGPIPIEITDTYGGIDVVVKLGEEGRMAAMSRAVLENIAALELIRVFAPNTSESGEAWIRPEDQDIRAHNVFDAISPEALAAVQSDVSNPDFFTVDRDPSMFSDQGRLAISQYADYLENYLTNNGGTLELSLPRTKEIVEVGNLRPVRDLVFSEPQTVDFSNSGVEFVFTAQNVGGVEGHIPSGQHTGDFMYEVTDEGALRITMNSSWARQGQGDGASYTLYNAIRVLGRAGFGNLAQMDSAILDVISDELRDEAFLDIDPNLVPSAVPGTGIVTIASE